MVRLRPASSTVATWPDEIATTDLTQATAGTRPYYSAASADFNGKPSVYNDDSVTGRWLRGAFPSNMGQEFEIVAIGRISDLSSGERVLFDSSPGGIASVRATPSQWKIANGFTSAQSGTADTSAHVFRAVFQLASDRLYVDETLTVTDTGENDRLYGITTGAGSGSPSPTGGTDWELVFIGVAGDGVLSAGNRSDIRTFSQSHYGTP